MNVRRVIVVAALVLTGCGSSQGDSEHTPAAETTPTPAAEYTYLPPGMKPNLVIGFLCESSQPRVITLPLVEADQDSVEDAVRVGEPHYDASTELCTVDMTFYEGAAVVAFHESFPPLNDNGLSASTTVATFTWESVWVQTSKLPDGRAWSDAEVIAKDNTMHRSIEESASI